MYIACWAQPKELLAAWVQNGVSVFICPEVGNPQTIAQADLHAKVKALGASYIDRPEGFPNTNNVASLTRLIQDPACLAIFLDDEPDLHAPMWNPNPKTNPELVGKFDAYVKAWLAARKWIIDACTLAKKPMFLNFTGTSVSNGRDSGYKGLIQHSFCDSWIRPIDILSSDWYPRNQSPNAQLDRYPNTFPGIATKNLHSDFPTVNVWGYVETSQINAGKGAAPTPADMDEQVNGQVANGAKGIAWFSHSLQAGWDPTKVPNGWDGRSAANKAKCLEIVQRLNGPIVVPVTLETRVAKLEDLYSGTKESLSSIVTKINDLEFKLSGKISNVTVSIEKS